MSRYRRARARGAVYFFTAVTFERRPILTRPAVRQALRAAWWSCRPLPVGRRQENDARGR